MNNEPTKEVRQWNGLSLNITTKTGEPRFSFAPPMTCDYGCIRGTWGAGLDGKALDVYVVSDAPTVFKVVQVTPAGAIDEHKYILGAQDFDHAVETFLKHVPKQLFGAASQYSIAQLQNDIMQQSKVKKDADELTELVQQLEILIESDDAYGSNIYVLSFETASDGDITGKFKDAWNGRIFSYSVEKDRIGYKPALTLDRADSVTAAKRFDIFSSGYTSLQVRQDAVKNGKKPRCTAISYSCGNACIQLKNTCWVNSSGQKVKKAGGAVASISQGRIDKLRTLARYLAANGNNKWSKYGSAENLATKAGLLEKKRASLIESGVKKQPLIKPVEYTDFGEFRKALDFLVFSKFTGEEVTQAKRFSNPGSSPFLPREEGWELTTVSGKTARLTDRQKIEIKIPTNNIKYIGPRHNQFESNQGFYQ